VDEDNANSLKTTVLGLRQCMVTEAEWTERMQRPEYLRFLERAVQDKELALELDKFLQEREGLERFVPRDILAKITAAADESQQPRSRADGFWGEDTEIPERFRANRMMFEFTQQGQVLVKIERATDKAFQLHAKQLISKTSTQDVKSDLQVELRQVPCSSTKCEPCTVLKHLQSPLHLSDWGEGKESIINYRQQLLQSSVEKFARQHVTRLKLQGYLSEFGKVITQVLERELGSQPAGQFTGEQKIKVQEEIFGQLAKLASQIDSNENRNFCVKDDFRKALRSAYGSDPAMFNQDTLPQTLGEILSSVVNPALSQEVKHFETLMAGEPGKLLERRKIECYDKAVVAELKTKVSVRIKRFCTKTCDLSSSVKDRIHAWVQAKLYQQLENVQREWDKKHSASSLLEDNKDQLNKTVDVVLTRGFTPEAHAELIAHSILKAINQLATEAEADERLRSILEQSWIATSERVRFEYFRELALEVQKGNKKGGIDHFRNPTTTFESWFKKKVEQCYKDQAGGETFRKHFEDEFQMCVKRVSGSQDFDEIEVKEWYQALTVTALVYEWQKARGLERTGFDAFKAEVRGKLNNARKQYEIIEPESPPLKNRDVMSRLGCTDACPMCGVMCLGERGHDDRVDITKIHHSSHQPMGLQRWRSNTTLRLKPRVCSSLIEEHLLYFGKFMESGIRFDVAKREQFSDWNFEKHYNQKFDQLMCWFMQQLHSDIARSCVSHPATQSPTDKELKDHGCSGLNIDDILQDLEHHLSS